jgi:hypothetical protein
MMVKNIDMLKIFILIFFKLIDHQGQCLAHFIMGSSFVAYGIVMLLMLRVGGPLLIRNGKSQEWYDSWVILLWGIVNTFTEHRYAYIRKKFYVAKLMRIFRWGQDWNHGDYQHTSMGVIWWAAGIAGIVLSRKGKRSVIPSILIILTAAAFQGHAQHVANSGTIHSYFGYMLAAGGLSRIIEICFVWKENEPTKIDPWQYLPPLVSIVYTNNKKGVILIFSFGISKGFDVGWYFIYGKYRRTTWIPQHIRCRCYVLH